MKTTGVVLACALALLFAGCHATEDSRPPEARSAVPDRAEDVQPLRQGARAPSGKLDRLDGRPVNAASLYADKPTVLIFYRGGWCPYCNAHLGQIATAEKDLLAMGYQVIAVSPDRPEELRKSVEKQHLTYQLLSDSEMTFARAFGLAFRVDDATHKKYLGYGIDLDKSSGQNHHLLPVPAVYIIDKSGVIRFAHWNSDYKTRLDPKALLDAARRAVQP